jgi:hypothetical protein
LRLPRHRKRLGEPNEPMAKAPAPSILNGFGKARKLYSYFNNIRVRSFRAILNRAANAGRAFLPIGVGATRLGPYSDLFATSARFFDWGLRSALIARPLRRRSLSYRIGCPTSQVCFGLPSSHATSPESFVCSLMKTILSSRLQSSKTSTVLLT